MNKKPAQQPKDAREFLSTTQKDQETKTSHLQKKTLRL